MSFIGQDYLRGIRLIKSGISVFQLRLKDLVVFTEAASGNYKWTPIIACMAGARKVYAVTKDSIYGKATDVIEETYHIASRLGLRQKLEIIKKKEPRFISQADIITNLGFVRPMDSGFIKQMKKTGVIALMWEPWEFRNEDIDLEYCKKFNIPVVGVNEDHKDLKIFRYVGLTAAKLLFENGIEIFKSKIIVIGSGVFLKEISHVLRSLEARLIIVDTDKTKRIPLQDKIDAVICAEHRHKDLMLIGHKGILNRSNIHNLGDDCKVIHICGKIEKAFLEENNISFIPRILAPFGHMSFRADYVGLRPLIYLHAAGLKAAESAVRLRLKGKTTGGLEKSLKICRLLKA